MRIISLACPKCGVINKSGRISCCGRGGSWFGNCGAAGKVKLDYKWSEGIEACKARSQFTKVIGQQLHGSQYKSNYSSNDTARVNSKAVTTALSTFTSTPGNKPTPMLDKMLGSQSNSASIDISTAKSIRTPINTSMLIPALIGTKKCSVITKTVTPMFSMHINMSTAKAIAPPMNTSITMSVNMTPIRTFMTNTSSEFLMISRARTSASTSVAAQIYKNPWKIAFHINILVGTIF